MQKKVSKSLNLPGQGCAFGAFRLESDGNLFHGEEAIPLPPGELAALRLLVANTGQIVTPLQLKEALWGEAPVAADQLPKCISSLRARLEPEAHIQAVYKRGYRFSAAVQHPGGEALPRLAILPFATGYTVPEHLGFALAEDTIARLSHVHPPALCVLARDSVFSLAELGRSPLEVGETLHADLVLTGTLSAHCGHFRVRMEMLGVSGGKQIWVEDFLVNQSRITHLEPELAARLNFRLAQEGLSLAAEATEPEPESTPNEREGFEIYLRGHHEWHSLQRHRMQDGLQQLLRATEVAPSLIPPRVDLAHLCVTQALYGYMSPAVSAQHIRHAAESVPDLAERAPALLPALGWIAFHVDHDLPAALHAFRQTEHLPHNPWITRMRSMFALSRHRFDEAVELQRAAIQLDPFSLGLHARLAWALHLAGRAAESVDCIHHALSLAPGHAGSSLYASVILAFNGEFAEATALSGQMTQRTPYFDLGTAAHAYVLARSGRKDEARVQVERLQWLSRERFVLSSFTPAVYVALDDPDSALAELRAAADARCPWFFQMLADPRLAALHGKPAFEQMLAVLAGMEEEAEKLAEREA